MSLARSEQTMILRIWHAAACLAILMLLGAPARADVVRSEQEELSNSSNLPITEWRDENTKLLGIIVMIHGVTLHAGVFDVAARNLASSGFLVVAPDLRGFGRWVANESVPEEDRKVNYTRSLGDTITLIEHLREQHPQMPIFCAGESLGANMAINLAAIRPEAVDGLILSSPCIYRRIFIGPYMVPDAVKSFKPSTQLSMKWYIGKRLSDDPKVEKGYRLDPSIRKTLSFRELIQSKYALQRGVLAARKVPAKIPVLILQGTADNLFKPEGVNALMAMLPCADEKVQWFKGRGHLLLETAYIRPEVVSTINGWLNDRLGQPELSAARVPDSKQPAGEDSKQVQ